MSEVISFRLDKGNPREAQALEVLKAWIEQGFSARFILTKALLELDHPDSAPGVGQDGHGLNRVLNKISQLLETLRLSETNTSIQQNHDEKPSILKDSFLASIRQGAKPGIRLR